MLVLCVRQMCYASQIRQHISLAIGCYNAFNSFTEKFELFHGRLFNTCNTLHESGLLLSVVVFRPLKCPHRWVVAVEQTLKSIVPSFHNVCCPCNSISSCISLISYSRLEESWTIFFSVLSVYLLACMCV